MKETLYKVDGGREVAKSEGQEGKICYLRKHEIQIAIYSDTS
jgi:hypothetical protein